MWEQIKEDLVLFEAREFFLLYLQGLILAQSFHLNLSIFFIKTCELQKSFLFGVAWAFGYSGRCHKTLLWKVIDEIFRSPSRLQALMDKVINQVWRNHTSAFMKHLPVCNLALGPEFLKQIQVHFDMNSKLEMFTEKL